MKRLILFTIAISISLVSCKKGNDGQNIQNKSVLEYYPLKVGNYWVYQTSNCDSTWTNCDSVRMDTNYVSKDTLIDGLQYYKIAGKKLINSSPVYLRDSLNYIVDYGGNVKFSDNDFQNIFHENYIIQNNDTLFHYYYKMQEDPTTFAVPMGNFSCLDFRLSLFRRTESFNHEFTGHSAYSKGVGLVYESILFATTTSGMKRELVSYGNNYTE